MTNDSQLTPNRSLNKRSAQTSTNPQNEKAVASQDQSNEKDKEPFKLGTYSATGIKRTDKKKARRMLLDQEKVCDESFSKHSIRKSVTFSTATKLLSAVANAASVVASAAGVANIAGESPSEVMKDIGIASNATNTLVGAMGAKGKTPSAIKITDTITKKASAGASATNNTAQIVKAAVEATKAVTTAGVTTIVKGVVELTSAAAMASLTPTSKKAIQRLEDKQIFMRKPIGASKQTESFWEDLGKINEIALTVKAMNELESRQSPNGEELKPKEVLALLTSTKEHLQNYQQDLTAHKEVLQKELENQKNLSKPNKRKIKDAISVISKDLKGIKNILENINDAARIESKKILQDKAQTCANIVTSIIGIAASVVTISVTAAATGPVSVVSLIFEGISIATNAAKLALSIKHAFDMALEKDPITTHLPATGRVFSEVKSSISNESQETTSSKEAKANPFNQVSAAATARAEKMNVNDILTSVENSLTLFDLSSGKDIDTNEDPKDISASDENAISDENATSPQKK